MELCLQNAEKYEKDEVQKVWIQLEGGLLDDKKMADAQAFQVLRKAQ